jgi:hypothetical protein
VSRPPISAFAFCPAVTYQRKLVLTLALNPTFSPGKKEQPMADFWLAEDIRPIPSHDIA